MPTRNVNLTPRFDKFIEDGIQSGKYSNASEVVREGLRLLELREKKEQARIEALRAAIQVGIDEIERGEYVVLKTPEEITAWGQQIFQEALAIHRKNQSAKRKRA